MKPDTIKKDLKEGTALFDTLTALYGESRFEAQPERYSRLCGEYLAHFGDSDRDTGIFSTPGRTEIGGNHTDHNHGRIIAAGIDIDTIAAAGKRDDGIITVRSDGYRDGFVVDCGDLDVRPRETQTTNALIRGIAAGMRASGYRIGGFNAYVNSDIGTGSGLSSSASFEILIATILNSLYNNGDIGRKELALIAQKAENEYFGKPCGLMDQLACAYGGIVAVDFLDPAEPVVEKLDFDFSRHGYCLAVVETGGSHADLTGEYAAIPGEMASVALAFGKSWLRDIESEAVIIDTVRSLSGTLSDRAILRAIHFFRENARVEKQTDSLKKGDLSEFLRLVRASGDSSFKWLQNCYVSSNSDRQPIPLALACTEIFIETRGEGACRVHGGGFAGTVLVFLPRRDLTDYSRYMKRIFSGNPVAELTIRKQGTLRIV
ncbi:MAG: galactokinase [Spirochaetales bacterium]|nr:galactokinase [Spirochaetales bacterium]